MGLPTIWVRRDEWYEFRQFQKGLNILLGVDERSFKSDAEKPVSELQPVAWFHEFDGGYAFYTALGHTKESYQEPLFLKHLEGGLLSVLGK